MCNYVIQKNTSDPSWLPKLWTSDEANFNLNGIYLSSILTYFDSFFLGLVNSRNVLCYSPRGQGRPDNFSIETVKHPDGVMVHPPPHPQSSWVFLALYLD